MIYKEYSNSRISEVIDEHIHNARNRLILKLRLIDGLTYSQIATDSRIDLTVKRVSMIVSAECAKIEKYL